MIWNEGVPGEGGIRFYLSYSGSAPSGANCTTLATDIATAAEGHLVQIINTSYTLEEVDVLDIATDSGLSGQWTGSYAGARSGTAVPAQCTTNIEFGIARRYRGGKPRCFLPGPVEADFETLSTWTSGFVGDVSTYFDAFMADVVGSSVGSMGTLTHVNLSYYKGFTNNMNPSGRERAIPTYRATALHDNVTSYIPKVVTGSQKRRRTSTTP